jgi:hypothetical protein
MMTKKDERQFTETTRGAGGVVMGAPPRGANN